MARDRGLAAAASISKNLPKFRSIGREWRPTNCLSEWTRERLRLPPGHTAPQAGERELACLRSKTLAQATNLTRPNEFGVSSGAGQKRQQRASGRPRSAPPGRLCVDVLDGTAELGADSIPLGGRANNKCKFGNLRTRNDKRAPDLPQINQCRLDSTRLDSSVRSQVMGSGSWEARKPQTKDSPRVQRAITKACRRIIKRQSLQLDSTWAVLPHLYAAAA